MQDHLLSFKSLNVSGQEHYFKNANYLADPIHKRKRVQKHARTKKKGKYVRMLAKNKHNNYHSKN